MTLPKPIVLISLFATVFAGILCSSTAAAENDADHTLSLQARFRVKSKTDEGKFEIQQKTVSWNSRETAIVVCDMWSSHWCEGATRRVMEMAPRANEVVTAARDKGVLIIHCPSGGMDYYKDTPMRELARQAPKVETEIPLQDWCDPDEQREGPLPIEENLGGCDCQPKCNRQRLVLSQITTIGMKEGDAITDSAEAYYLMKQRGIKNVIVMGVHTNVCVLGRPFSIRQMLYQGQNVLLMRDLTDSWYNPRGEAPRVPHARATERVIEHIEKYWCPTITSTEFSGTTAHRFAEDNRTHVVFLVNDNHYHSASTLPQFAQHLQDRFNYSVTFIEAEKDRGFVGTEVLKTANLLVVYARRAALSKQQQQDIRDYLNSGKPLIGLRTANHAFGAQGKLPNGLVSWNEFDGQVLGGNYNGHYSDGSEITLAAHAAGHPILDDIKVEKWKSSGSLYKVAPIDKKATLVLVGSKDGDRQPVAWTRQYNKSRIFYISLGHPDDFQQPHFLRLLTNAVQWSLFQPDAAAGKGAAAKKAESRDPRDDRS